MTPHSRHCPCFYCERIRRRRLATRLTVESAILIALVIFFFIAGAGCTSTVTPSIVVPAQASYSGNTRNSGLIAYTDAGWVVDGSFRQRYDALIAKYGAAYGLKPGDGIAKIMDGATPEAERWLIDRRHFDLMAKMNVKAHSAIQPAP